MNGISALIPWRSEDPWRIALWEFIRPLWGDEVEICDTDDGLTGAFSRTKAYNRAFQRSTGDVLVMHGANMIPDLDAISRAADIAREHGWSFIYGDITVFTMEDTESIINGGDIPRRGSTPTGTFAGAMAIRRDAWIAAGGMDERFGTGYGFEDCAMRNKLGSIYGRPPAVHGWLRSLNHGENADLKKRITPANAKLFFTKYANLAPDLN